MQSGATMSSMTREKELPPKHWASQVALLVKNPPANAADIRDTVPSLGQEDPLEKEMATYSNILAWKIPRTESLTGYSPWGRKESGTAKHACNPIIRVPPS